MDCENIKYIKSIYVLKTIDKERWNFTIFQCRGKSASSTLFYYAFALTHHCVFVFLLSFFFSLPLSFPYFLLSSLPSLFSIEFLVGIREIGLLNILISTTSDPILDPYFGLQLLFCQALHIG